MAIYSVFFFLFRPIAPRWFWKKKKNTDMSLKWGTYSSSSPPSLNHAKEDANWVAVVGGAKRYAEVCFFDLSSLHSIAPPLWRGRNKKELMSVYIIEIANSDVLSKLYPWFIVSPNCLVCFFVLFLFYEDEIWRHILKYKLNASIAARKWSNE